MTTNGKNEEIELSSNTLRQLEVEAYSALISTFFAQGELTWRKEQLLQEARWALKISDDMHRRELQRIHADSILVKLRNNSVKDLYFPNLQPSSTSASFPTSATLLSDPNKKTRLTAFPLGNSAPGEAATLPSSTSKKSAQKKRPSSGSKGRPPAKKAATAPPPTDEELQALQAKKEALEQAKQRIAMELKQLDEEEENDEDVEPEMHVDEERSQEEL